MTLADWLLGALLKAVIGFSHVSVCRQREHSSIAIRKRAGRSLIAFLFAVLTLGVAGLDPLGALLMAGALAGGATRKGVAAFTAAAAGTTIAVGVACSLLLAPFIDRLAAAMANTPDVVWLALELGLAILLLVWGVRRLRAGVSKEKPRKKTRSLIDTSVLLGAGVVFGISALTDPTYYGVIVLAGRDEPIWLVVIAHVLWFVVSQAPLLALTIAAARGSHVRLAQKLQGYWEQWRPTVGRVITAMMFVGAALLMIDCGFYLATGAFLIE